MAISKKPTISVFFPCYNDSKSIAQLIDNANIILKDWASKYEIIVVEDGSSDNSREILKELKLKYRNLRLIFHKMNTGYGGALKSGFKEAQYDLIFYTDGDGQYDVKELPLLLLLMTPDVNFVNGIKMSRQDTWSRIFFGNMHKFLTRWFFWLPIYDTDCDFRLIRKSIIKKLDLKSNSGSICVELVKKSQRVGGVFRQVSVHHYDRKYGNSQFFKPAKIIKTYLDISRLWFQLMVFEKITK